MRAIVAGFAAPGQAVVLAPHTWRYFDFIVDVWTNRPEAVATTIATGLYPLRDVSQECIDAADALLTREPPPPLVRLIHEGQDEMKRALAARIVDAGSGH